MVGGSKRTFGFRKSRVTTSEPAPATAQAPPPIRVRKSRRLAPAGSGLSLRSDSSDMGALRRVEALHRDGADGTARSAEAAADARFLVLDEDGSAARAVGQNGSELARGRRQVRRALRDEDLDAVLRADVLASAAEDALGALRRALLEDRVRPAVEAALPFEPRLALREAFLDLGDADAARDRAGRRRLARNPLEIEVPLVAIVHVDLDRHLGRRPRPAPEEGVDRKGAALPVRDGVDRDAGTERRVAARVHPGRARRKRFRIDRDPPAARLDPVLRTEEGEVPGLSDRDEDGVGRENGLRALHELGRETPRLVEHARDVEKLDAGHGAVLPDEPLRSEPVAEVNALAPGFVDLVLRGGHLALRLEAADDHLPRAETDGAARHAEGRVAAADHDDAPAHLDLVPEVDVQEVVDAFQDTVQLHPGDREGAALHGADPEEDRGEALRFQVGQREVPAETHARFQLHAEREDGVDLELDEGARQAVLRDSEPQHPPGDGRRLEDRHRVTHQGEVVRAREPGRTRADDGHALRVPVRAVSVDRGQDRKVHHAFDAEALGDETLQGPDRDGSVQLAAPAHRFAGGRADPAADGGERVRPARHGISLAVLPLGDERDVLAGLGVDRTRRLAGEVPLEPVAADVGHGRYLAISKSAAEGPATVTAFCAAFSFGCHTFTVYAPSGTFAMWKDPSAFVTAK